MCRKWAGLVAVEAVAVMAAVNFGCFFEGVFGVFRSGGSGVVVPMDLHCFWGEATETFRENRFQMNSFK